MRSYHRNIGVNFWFNYEKLFEFDEFSGKCRDNKFDITKDLDSFKLENEEENHFTQFK